MTRFLDAGFSIWAHGGISAWTNSPALLRLGSALLHFLWQGALLAAVALLLLLALRRATPRLRYNVLLTLFFLMAACPAVTFCLLPTETSPFVTNDPSQSPPTTRSQGPPWERTTPRLPPRSPSEPLTTADSPPPSDSIINSAAKSPAPNRLASVTAWLTHHRHWIVLAWLAGVCLLSLRLSLGLLGARLARHRHVKSAADSIQQIVAKLTKQMHIRLTVQVLESAVAEVPTLVGWLQPVILLPTSVISGLSPAELEAILAHELAHIRRHDYAINLLQTVIETILFYHPAIWWLSRLIRQEREHCCDDIALSICRDRLTYARALTTLEQLRPTPSWAIAANSGSLLNRIRRIVGKPQSADSNRLALFVIAVVLTLVVGLAVPRTAPVTAQEQKPSAAPKTASETTLPEDRADPLTYHCLIVDRETGRGLPNATITVERSDSKEDHYPFKLIAKTTHVSDAEGKFTVEIPSEQSGNPWLYIQVLADHENYVSIPGIGYGLHMLRKNERLGERPFFERLEMQPANTITGKIVSPTGQPLADTVITGFTNTTARDLENPRWLRTQTAADGSFRLNVVKGGMAYFWALPAEFGIVRKVINTETGDLGTIPVPSGVRIRGRVLDAGGQPLAGIFVNAHGEEPDGEPTKTYHVTSSRRRGALTDAEGRFSLDPLPPGDYSVIPQDEISDARDEEHPVHPLPAVFVAQELTLRDGAAPPDLEIRAVPHVTMHVQCLDSQGKKQPGHEFWISGDSGKDQFWSVRGRPDKDGAVTLRLPRGLKRAQMQIPTNEHSALRVRKGAGQPVENFNYSVHLDKIDADIDGFEIIRYRAPVVVAQVVDEAGKPIKGFDVVAKYAWMENVKQSISMPLGDQISFERQKDGRVRSEQMLPDEEADISFKAAGYQSVTETMKLAEDETKDLVVKLKRGVDPKEPPPKQSPKKSQPATKQPQKQAEPAKKAASQEKPPAPKREYELRVVNKRGEPVVGAVVTPTGAGYTYEGYKCGDIDCGSLEKIRLNNGMDAGCMSLSAELFPAFKNPPQTDAQGKVRIVISEEDAKQIMAETLRKVEITRLCVTIDHPNHPRFDSESWLYEDEPFVLPDGVAVQIRARRDGENRLASNIYPVMGYDDISADVTEQDGLLTIRRVDLAKDAPHRWLRVVQISDSEPPRFSESVDLKQYTTSPIVLNLTLKPGARVAGRLSDNVPRPVKNGRVLAFMVRGTDYSTNWAWQAATDITADGGFEFPSLPPDENLQLIAICDGWVSSAPSYASIASYHAEHGVPAELSRRHVYEHPVEGDLYPNLYRLIAAGLQPVIPMEPTLTCEVQVLDLNNQPIAGARVFFQPNQRWFDGGAQHIGWEHDSLADIRHYLAKEKASSSPAKNLAEAWLSKKTDANGVATISNLPACNFADPTRPYEHKFTAGHDEFVVIGDGTPSNAPFPMLTAKITPGETGKVTVRMQPK